MSASLARKLIADVSESADFADVDISEWVDPDYCYVAGLVHDLGHPPFGHAGEQTLQDILSTVPSAFEESAPAASELRDPYERRARSFEGNAQSTRIVTALSFRKERDEPGLNLTLRSLAGIAKYPWMRGEHPSHVAKLARKWSFYPEEAHLLERLESGGFIRVERRDTANGREVSRVWRWPEAEIMDWADDITYAVHDLEDFFRAGMIPLARIRSALRQAPEKVNWATTDFDFVADDEIRACFGFIKEKLAKIIVSTGEHPTPQQIAAAWARTHELIIEHIPATPFSGSRKSHAELQKFGSTLIIVLSEGAALRHEARVDRVHLELDASTVVIAELFKALNAFFVIENSTLATMQYGQANTLRTLFSALVAMSLTWLNGLEDSAANRRLPARLREYLLSITADGEGLADEALSNRVQIAVVDYICGLRDVQAVALASRLDGSRETLSISGRWLDS